MSEQGTRDPETWAGSARLGGLDPRDVLEALDEGVVVQSTTGRILAVNEALAGLHAIDPFLARVVELRFFGGLTVAEAAQVLGAGERTVHGAWETARTLLHRKLLG